MEKNMELLLCKLDEKLDRQAEQITQSVTRNVMEAIDDKMNTIIEENIYLKNKIKELETKIKSLETVKRKNNLVFFGVEEKGKTETELIDFIKETVESTGVQMYSQEISNIYRIGRRTENSNQPVVVSFTTIWKKHLILKNKSNLPPNIYVKEDYSKEIIEKRKQLQPQVEEERKKGNIAYLKQDQLIVIKSKDNNREKKKERNFKLPQAVDTEEKKTRSDPQLNNPKN
ncbi:unnamed protein product [Euphydryas editha]|uniref:Endonuclease-reverse transcriptase n=1 Tax=Euphydryas editha TaxID=104508 RepID=A0AAU9U7T6_EUPED|nr:unnamed protein product [Euphydryas editha]